MNLGITAYSELNEKGLYKNGILLLANEGQEPFVPFAKEVYRFLNPVYSKFHKMDELCKLAFLATEALLSEDKISSNAEGADVALILGNRSSSIASDLQHLESYRDSSNYFPSPAVFVYTLPNIMLGEICIRHQVTGENSCFLMQAPDGRFLYRYVQHLFEQEAYQQCITGWVDYKAGNYKACLFLVEKAAVNKPVLRKFDYDFI
ncbi:hypothetical protein [Cesiribacter sp. SM1]|uniref:hypothetical protein n=1 Tax=Cesiribacter sp. SM1 TaxID=2861196 RepID=UPI001CD332B7|nr:hypothetical protein [Cesiribacter sp. SM1]